MHARRKSCPSYSGSLKIRAIPRRAKPPHVGVQREWNWGGGAVVGLEQRRAFCPGTTFVARKICAFPRAPLMNRPAESRNWGLWGCSEKDEIFWRFERVCGVSLNSGASCERTVVEGYSSSHANDTVSIFLALFSPQFLGGCGSRPAIFGSAAY